MKRSALLLCFAAASALAQSQDSVTARYRSVQAAHLSADRTALNAPVLPYPVTDALFRLRGFDARAAAGRASEFHATGGSYSGRGRWQALHDVLPVARWE